MQIQENGGIGSPQRWRPCGTPVESSEGEMVHDGAKTRQGGSGRSGVCSGRTVLGVVSGPSGLNASGGKLPFQFG